MRPEGIWLGGSLLFRGCFFGEGRWGVELMRVDKTLGMKVEGLGQIR